MSSTTSPTFLNYPLPQNCISRFCVAYHKKFTDKIANGPAALCDLILRIVMLAGAILVYPTLGILAKIGIKRTISQAERNENASSQLQLELGDQPFPIPSAALKILQKQPTLVPNEKMRPANIEGLNNCVEMTEAPGLIFTSFASATEWLQQLEKVKRIGSNLQYLAFPEVREIELPVPSKAKILVIKLPKVSPDQWTHEQLSQTHAQDLKPAYQRLIALIATKELRAIPKSHIPVVEPDSSHPQWRIAITDLRPTQNRSELLFGQLDKPGLLDLIPSKQYQEISIVARERGVREDHSLALNALEQHLKKTTANPRKPLDITPDSLEVDLNEKGRDKSGHEHTLGDAVQTILAILNDAIKRNAGLKSFSLEERCICLDADPRFLPYTQIGFDNAPEGGYMNSWAYRITKALKDQGHLFLAVRKNFNYYVFA